MYVIIFFIKTIMYPLISQKTPVLEPVTLNGLTQIAIDELLREGQSRNTLASYRSALRYWAAWYGLRYGHQIELPLPATCVLQFIVDHAERTTANGLMSELPVEIDQALVESGYKGKLGALAHNTLAHRIAVLSKAHQLQALKNPCHDAQVRELLSRTRKAYARRGVLPQKKEALTKDPLQAILATCDDTLQGKRDRALLLFAWSTGGRRRSEVSGADMKFLKKIPKGFVYTLAYSKTNQSGMQRPENEKPLLGSAAAALSAWLEITKITEGRIFRQIRKGGRLGDALGDASVRDIVKKRCRLAGLEGDFSAHSLRSGFVTEAGQQNMALAEIMTMTGHHSVATVLGYSRAGSTLSSGLARLFDSDES